MFGFPNWIVLLVVAAVSAAGASWGTAEIYSGKIARIELAHEKAQTAALKKGQELQRDADQAAIEAASAQVVIQEKIVTKTLTLTKEIPIYVQDTSSCITYGLIRVLDAAALGADPAALDLPAGAANDTCAPVTATALAQSVTGNYGIAHQNAGELTGLQAYVFDLKTKLEKAGARP